MKRSGLLILAESPKSRAWCCADVEAMVVNALFDTGSSFGLFRRDAYSGPCGYARSYTCSDGNAPADCNARADSDSYARADGNAPADCNARADSDSYARAYGHTHADCNARADSDSYARAYGHTHAAADSNPSARRNPGARRDRGARRDPGSDDNSPGPRRRPDGNFRDRSARSP